MVANNMQATSRLNIQVISQTMVANNMKAISRLKIQYNYYIRLLLNCLVYLQAVKHLYGCYIFSQAAYTLTDTLYHGVLLLHTCKD